MSERTIAHALLMWTDDDGIEHTTQCGRTVDLPEHVIDRFTPLGAFEIAAVDYLADDEPTPVLDAVVEDIETPEPQSVTETLTTFLDRPRHTAPKESWVDYAAELHRLTEGDLGFERTTAEAYARRDLITALSEQSKENDNA